MEDMVPFLLLTSFMNDHSINELIFNRYASKNRVGIVDPLECHFILTEGQNSELMYLSGLLDSDMLLFNNIKIVPLQRSSEIADHSDPYHLLDYMLAFKISKTKDDEIEKNDTFYIMFDRDSFKGFAKPKEDYLAYLNAVYSNGLEPLVSSPCFEFWLLLHKDDVYRKSQEDTYRLKMFENRVDKKTNKTFAHKKCEKILGFNPKSEFDNSIIDFIRFAINQSLMFENNPLLLADRLGTNLGVYFNSVLTTDEE